MPAEKLCPYRIHHLQLRTGGDEQHQFTQLLWICKKCDYQSKAWRSTDKEEPVPVMTRLFGRTKH